MNKNSGFNRAFHAIRKIHIASIRIKEFIRQSNTKADHAESDGSFFSRHPVLLLVTLVILFATALGLRIYHIEVEPFDYRPARIYNHALAARSFYYSTLDSIPEWQSEVAAKQRTGMAQTEMAQTGTMIPLPTIEGIAYLLYRLAGGEHIWLPRLFSALSWLAGGIVLYLLAKRIINTDAAVFSTAFYLLLPWGVSASRLFSAEPLMVMAMLCSIYAIILYNDRPTLRRAFIAGLIAGIAILIRLPCVFLIFGAFLALTIGRQGLRKSISDQYSWLIASLALLPTALLTIYDHFYLGGYGLETFETIYFYPNLIISSFFYAGWWKQIADTVGIASLLVALFGTFLLFRFHSKTSRYLAIGLWCGYIVYGVVFTWHVPTHDYYQLQFVPLVALCLGPVGALILARVSKAGPRWPSQLMRVAVLGLLILLVASSIITSVNRIAITNVDIERFEYLVNRAEEIGEHVGHSSNTVFLDPTYGRYLQYYGWIAGVWWPTKADLRKERLTVGERLPAEERFYSEYSDLNPEYFIVTPLKQFEEQPDLKEFLARFVIVAQGENYLIFDLRKTIDSG